MTKTVERSKTVPAPSSLPEVDDATRKDFLIGAAGLLLLPAACGRQGGDGSPTDETRVVEDFYGKVELPADPKRLVPGYHSTTDYALMLGIPVAASSGLDGAVHRPFPEYQLAAYPEKLKRLEKVQTYPEANLEQIAAARPDCILDALSIWDENRYGQLSEIAPTFALKEHEEVETLEYGRPDWQGALQNVGGAFGYAREAEGIIADYKARAEKLRGRLSERPSGATFAIVEPAPESLFVYGRDASQPHQILFDDLDLTPASVLEPDTQELSLEALPEIDADVLFLGLIVREGGLERDRELVRPYVNSPLWQRIPAVRQDQVYEFDTELQYTSPLTAAAFLDFVEKILLS